MLTLKPRSRLRNVPVGNARRKIASPFEWFCAGLAVLILGGALVMGVVSAIENQVHSFTVEKAQAFCGLTLLSTTRLQADAALGPPTSTGISPASSNAYGSIPALPWETWKFKHVAYTINYEPTGTADELYALVSGADGHLGCSSDRSNYTWSYNPPYRAEWLDPPDPGGP
jgi:hypothetical protein